jgi:hypothetical protein
VRAVHPDRTVAAYATGSPKAAAAAIDAAARVNAGSLPTRGEGIRVGVIDTGIDYTHPALGGAFGAGHKVAGGWDFVNNDDDPKDDFGHGTHVAGIIAADSPEIAGVAPAATLFAYKVLDFRGAGYLSDVIAGIERSITDHLDVINISLGTPGNADDLVSRAADNAMAAGIVVVVAAGNAGVPDSIGSPGAARSVITVGALASTSTAVALFSSRGPSPGSLGFKPDVMAPGSAIPSTYLGSAIASLDGTSMAAPHVAGAAALLRKLHPSWTPAEIKSALVTTAVSVSGTRLSRAAGRIDVARADAATTFVDGAGISFGLASAKSGTFEAVRTIAVTNRAADAQAFTVAATNVPAGVTLTATPPALQLAPGETKSVELRFVLDAVTAFPASPFLEGDIEFRGIAPFALPWFVARAARITVSYDMPVTNVIAHSPEGVTLPFVYDLDKSEIFARPDTQFDFLVLAYDFLASPAAVHMAFAENRVASGDSEVVLHRGDTTAELLFDVRDKSGMLFGELPSQINRLRTVRYLYSRLPGTQVSIRLPASLPKLFFTAVSPAFTFYLYEAYFDVENGRAYNVQHPPLAGVAQSATLSAGPAAYKRARVRFPQPRQGPNAVFACHTIGLRAARTLAGCSPVELGPQMVLEYFTNDASGEAVSGIDFDTGATFIGSLRALDGAIVPVGWDHPSPDAYRISDGEEITLETAPLHPFSFFGTVPNRYIGSMPGFVGPFGNWYRYVTTDTPWTAYDAAGAQIATGVYSNLTTCDEGPCDPGPDPRPGGRFVAARNDMSAGGQPSRGEIEARFGNDARDLIAPTLTALRVLNAQGRLAEKLEPNSNASLFFAAGDYEYPALGERRFGSTRDLKRDATKVFYRAHGTANWISLTPVHQGSDLGSIDALRRFPAGEIYRADLGAVTRAGASAIDLRIEIEDVAGNQTTWTQSPAILVSGNDGTPSKRRAARH